LEKFSSLDTNRNSLQNTVKMPEKQPVT